MNALVVAAIVVWSAATLTLADNGQHGGQYHSHDSGVFWFYFFFIIIIMVMFVGCIGGIFTWGGRVRTVRIERIVDRDATGRIIRDRTINDSQSVTTDENQYTMAQPYGERPAGNPPNQYRPLPAPSSNFGSISVNAVKRTSASVMSSKRKNPLKLNFNV